MQNRILSLFLAGLLTLPLLASCGGVKSEIAAEQTTAAVADTSAAETELTRANMPDNVPDLDFKGVTVRALCRDDTDGNAIFQQEFYAPEETGDVLTDTIHARNAYVEERLNIKFDVTLTPGAWGDRNAFMGIVTASAMAGDGSIDFVPWYAFVQPSLSSQHVYLDLLSADAKYLDLKQPWWYQKANDNATINGHLYTCAGEYGLTTIAMMAAIAFNDNLRQDILSSADFYQDVRDGKWTFDKMLSYAKAVYKDTNGDGAQNKGDVFGYNGGRADQYIHSANVTISKVGADGIPVLALNNERMILLVEKMQGYYSDKSYGGKVTDLKFSEGDLLFSNSYIRDIAKNREMEDDYGILPMPKLDEEQTEYKTTLGDSYSILGIMTTSKNLDATCATVELMTAESYRSVTEVYFESCLKSKYARDAATGEMLDILLAGIEIDFVETFATLCNSPVGKMRDVLQDTCKEFASTYAALESGVNEQIKAIYETYK